MEWLQLFVILLALELPAEYRHKYPSSITPAGQSLNANWGRYVVFLRHLICTPIIFMIRSAFRIGSERIGSAGAVASSTPRSASPTGHYQVVSIMLLI
jgi:hypothetical protein